MSQIMKTNTYVTNNESKQKVMFWYSYIGLIGWIVATIYMVFYFATKDYDGIAWSGPVFILTGTFFVFSILYNLPEKPKKPL